MLNINKVFLAGCLTRDPDFRSTAGGTALCEFGIATNRTVKGGEKETCFAEVTVWGKSAEACRQYLARGSNVYLEGRLTFEQWQDRSGAKKSRLKITADSVHFVSNRPEPESDAGDSGRGSRRRAPGGAPYGPEDDPPGNNGDEEAPPF